MSTAAGTWSGPIVRPSVHKRISHSLFGLIKTLFMSYGRSVAAAARVNNFCTHYLNYFCTLECHRWSPPLQRWTKLNRTEHLQTFWNFNHSIWRTHVAFAAKDINKMSLLCRALINFVFVLFLSLQVQMDCEDAVDRLTLGTKRWSWRRNSTQIIIWHGEDASKWLMHSASPSDRYACTFIRPMNNFRIYPWQNSCSSVSYSYTTIELEI